MLNSFCHCDYCIIFDEVKTFYNYKTMNSITQKIVLVFCSFALSFVSFGQPATAMDFNTSDCNGNPVHLFSDLDAGNAVVLFYYMPSCGTCPPHATEIQTMANSINSLYPGKVKAYSFPYQDVTDCLYSASWVINNNLPLYTPMINGAASLAYYGAFAMPTIVLLGGNSHDVMMVLDQGFDVSDTIAMRDSILNLLNSSSSNINENKQVLSSLTIYPNPTSDLINVTFNLHIAANVLIEMTDVKGKRIFTSVEENVEKGIIKKEFNVSQIPNGIYFIKIEGEGITATEKVIVRH